METEMKKLTLALAGASVALTGVMATPAAAADFGRHDRNRYEQVQTRTVERGRFVTNDRFQRDNRFQARRWQRGERFDSRYASNYMVVSNPYAYHLRAAPRGYRWVRSGNDAVMVAIASGIIGALVANAF
jgi:Ni/Co efflux regulator RcnB